jgi:uncharacterized protein (DUF2062 family)
LETAKKKLIAFLKMGMTPERLALCIGFGIAFGLVPALGTTTLLCTLAAFLFRLNLPAIQLVNYFVYPLQLALLIPFIRAGEWLFGTEPLNLSLESIQRMMKADLWETVISLWSTTMRAVMVWLLIAPVIVALVYVVMTPLLKKLKPGRLTAAS